MAASPFPRSSKDFLDNLFTLIQEQKKHLTEYITILQNELTALEQGDDEKIDLYRQHEADCRDKFVSTGNALRTLEASAKLTPEEYTLLHEEKKQLERLRQAALSANTLTQSRLTATMKEIESELASLSESLKKIEGGKTQENDDPQYIDMYT